MLVVRPSVESRLEVFCGHWDWSGRESATGIGRSGYWLGVGEGWPGEVRWGTLAGWLEMAADGGAG